MASEAGNSSSSSGSNRIAPPKLCEYVPYRSQKNKLLMWKLFCNVGVKEQNKGLLFYYNCYMITNKPLGTNGPQTKNDSDKTQDIRMPDSMFLVY